VGLEAGRLGVPAVAFDVGGIREWLQHGVNGYLAPGDPPRASALADAIAHAFRHPGELARLRANAVRAAREATLAGHLDRLDCILSGAALAHAHPAGR
jgi:glycosyltransferase involved in cell wall biosynthesis